MQKILLSDFAIVVYEGILLIFLLINSIRLRNKNKRIAEMVSLQMDRIREENLDASLRNTMYIQQSNAVSNKNNPYDVIYHQEEKNIYEDTRDRISIQVEERGILSTKKYVVHVFDSIQVGNDDSNTIILNDLSIARHQIQLMKVEKELFIKNLDCSNQVYLLRNKRKNNITEIPVCVKSSDTIMLGNTRLIIMII